MSRNGQGEYKLPISSWYPPINGNIALPVDWKLLIEDVARALSQSVSSDGQTPMTGDMNMSGYKISGLGVAQANGDALRRGSLMKGADIPATQILVLPFEGSVFDVVGTATVEGISTSYPGRTIWLGFSAGVTLKNGQDLILPGNEDWTTFDGEMGLFIQINEGSWQCVLKGPLGTAAGRDVGTSSGNLMEVGAFGFGGTSPQVTNLNNLAGTRMFGFADTATGAPPSGGAYDACGLQIDAAGQKSQLVNTSTNTWLLRTNDDGSWGSWVTIASADAPVSSFSGSLPVSRVSGITISTGNPSGGSNGDIWLKV